MAGAATAQCKGRSRVSVQQVSKNKEWLRRQLSANKGRACMRGTQFSDDEKLYREERLADAKIELEELGALHGKRSRVYINARQDGRAKRLGFADHNHYIWEKRNDKKKKARTQPESTASPFNTIVSRRMPDQPIAQASHASSCAQPPGTLLVVPKVTSDEFKRMLRD
jgi:hypothetical protein